MIFFVWYATAYFFLLIGLIYHISNRTVLRITLVSISGLDLSFSFLFDYVSLGFFRAVSFISSMVFFYSKFYMEEEVNQRRFNWLVFGFVISIGILVFSGNFISLMVGWDGLGLISFCLVIFYSNYSRLESGLITVFTNRIGDVFFLACFLLLFLGEERLSSCWLKMPFLTFPFLFLGAITKRAQFPFSAWLPAAIAAPTPVSSLVHSSTLVTAGIYVLVRFHYLFFFFNTPFMKIFFISTIILAGFCACIETDFKKIVAISTLSQLGMMLFTLCVRNWVLTFIHIIIHAFFKSLLFITTGSLIHDLIGGQDSRFFGGSIFSYNCFLCFFVSCTCLIGFPFFIGFYSKDLILLRRSLVLGRIFYILFVSGCFLTVFYRFRLLKRAYTGFITILTQRSNIEDKAFVLSVFFLFSKSWVLGRVFFPLIFFDNSYNYTTFDLLSGLALIFIVLLLHKRSLKKYLYIFTIGYLRWLSSSSSAIFINKPFKWDARWLELSGGQGVHKFLLRFCSLDFFKYFGLGLIFLLVLIILLISYMNVSFEGAEELIKFNNISESLKLTALNVC